MNIFQQDKLALSAIAITVLTTGLAHTHLSADLPETLFRFPRAATLLFQFRYTAAATLIYVFFRLISKTDPNRSRQLREVGLFDLLRNSAVFFCAYAQLIHVGQARSWVQPDLHLLPGAISLIVLLIGVQCRQKLPAPLNRVLNAMGADTGISGQRTFSRGLLLSGLIGICNVHHFQILSLLIPLTLTVITTRIRHPQTKAPNA
ncbi:MAG: hypothetical protein O7G87_21300 [bacterium]|nr:hypothetical protein [bacterium]